MAEHARALSLDPGILENLNVVSQSNYIDSPESFYEVKMPAIVCWIACAAARGSAAWRIGRPTTM